MSMKIVPTTSAHYPGIAAVINSLFPGSYTTALEITDGDQPRDLRFKFQRWAAIEQDQVVGTGSYSQSIWFDHPQKFMIWVGVAPGHQKGGIGSALYEAIMHGLEPYDPLALRVTATQDRPQSIRFLEKGFPRFPGGNLEQ